MGFYKISILSGAFSHLMKSLIDRNAIVEIFAARRWSTSQTKKISDEIPYLSKRVETNKVVMLRKDSPTTRFDSSKVFKWLREEDVQDLAIDNFSLLIKSDDLKKVLENKLGTKLIDKDFVLKFKKNPDVRGLEKLGRKVMENMELQINELGFKIQSLDLIGVWHLKDYMKDRTYNLLEDVKGDKAFMEGLANSFLNEFVLIKGKQSKIRAVKYYEMDTKEMLVLKDAEIM